MSSRHTRQQVAAILDRIDERVAANKAPTVDAVALIQRVRNQRDAYLARVIAPPAASG